MTRFVSLVGWIVAAATIAIAVTLNMRVTRLEGEIEHLQAALEVRERQVEELADVAETETASLDQAAQRDEHDGSEPVAETAPSEAAPPATDANVDESSTETEPANGEVPGTADAETGEDADAGGTQQARQEKVANAQLDMLMGMAYARLFAELNLPADVENQVRDLLVKRASEARGAVLAAMAEGETPAKKVTEQDDEAKKRLREALGRILNAEELAAWESYEEYADHYLYQNLLDGQLSMLAPGLSADNRQVTKDVFAEELVLHLDAFGESDTVYTLDNFNAAQSAALHQGLARLTDVLDAEQYAHAEAFVQQCDAMFGAMSE